MGEGEPEVSTAAGRLSAVLARWEESGAHWRVGEQTRERAEILLCACTGEVVDVLAVTEPAELAELERRTG